MGAASMDVDGGWVEKAGAQRANRGVAVASTVYGGFEFFFSSRRRHTRLQGDWSSDVCSSDLEVARGHDAILVADEPVGGDARGVELDLQLHVLGDGDKRGAGLVDQHFACFFEVDRKSVV